MSIARAAPTWLKNFCALHNLQCRHDKVDPESFRIGFTISEDPRSYSHLFPDPKVVISSGNIGFTCNVEGALQAMAYYHEHGGFH